MKCRKDQKRMAAASYRGRASEGRASKSCLGPRKPEIFQASRVSRHLRLGSEDSSVPFWAHSTGDFRNVECWMLKEIRPLLNCCSHPFTPIHLDKFGAYPHPERA